MVVGVTRWLAAALWDERRALPVPPEADVGAIAVGPLARRDVHDDVASPEQSTTALPRQSKDDVAKPAAGVDLAVPVESLHQFRGAREFTPCQSRQNLGVAGLRLPTNDDVIVHHTPARV